MLHLDKHDILSKKYFNINSKVQKAKSQSSELHRTDLKTQTWSYTNVIKAKMSQNQTQKHHQNNLEKVY